MDGKRTAQPGAASAAKRTASPAKKKSRAPWLAAAAIAGVLTGAVLGVGLYANSTQEVFPGVTVEGTDLSGLSRTELERSLAADQLLSGSVTITADGETLGTYGQAELGATVNGEALADAAWAVGREEGALGWIKNGWTMVAGSLGSETELVPEATPYDEAVLRRTAAELAAAFDREPVDGSYELSREGLFATKPAEGRALNQDGLVQALQELDGAPGEVEAPWDAVAAQPLNLEEMALELVAEATPARYDRELGKVVDGEPGVRLDVGAAKLVLEAAAPGERVQLPAEAIYPKLTAQELEAVLFRDVLGTATTNVSGTSVRKGNVRLSGELVNGTVLNDGDIFDYNQVVGKRTVERGFGAAASYVNGQTVDTVGGGICQTSSTIYLAALNSNLEIVERYNHRFWPGYIPKGMDATVSWGGPDFRFKNNTGYPVRVDVTYANSTLTVTFVGTKTDDTYVEMTNEVLSTTNFTTEYEETDELPYGEQRQKQSGYTGYEVVTYRNVYDGNGNLISKTQEAKSSYKSRNKIILVGTAGAPGTAASPAGEGNADSSGSNGSGNESGLAISGSDEPLLPDESEAPDWLGIG